MSSFKRITTLLAVILCLIGSTAFTQEKTPVLSKFKGPYLGQEPPGSIPEIFAPGIVSNEDSRELEGTFSPDGKEFYFTRAIDNTWVILVSRIANNHWTQPEPVNFSAGHTALESHVTFDNRYILFVWRGAEHEGMYVSERTPDGWSEAKHAGRGMMASSTRDGEMYVTDRSLEPNQVVLVNFENGLFKKYTTLQGEITEFQKENRTAHPCVAPDGSYLIFDTSGDHMYVSFKYPGNRWGYPIDLTEHGFNQAAGIAKISPDGKYLFFGEKDDIYWVSTKVIEKLKPADLR